jgi:MarR family transcriptional regulator for hemolysin
MVSRSDEPNKSVGFLLNDVARLLRRNFLRRVQNLGLSQAQWRALAYLARQEGVNQVTLAESLEIQPITLVRLIDRLEEAGLVKRHRDPDDRRAVESRADALAGIRQADQDMLVETLLRMKRNLLDAEDAAHDDNDEQDAIHVDTRKKGNG